MQKIITKDNLGDFIAKMWDAGIKCDLNPADGSIVAWSPSLSAYDKINVVDINAYDGVVSSLISSLGQRHDPSGDAHSTNSIA